jgi:hypothetical protein
MTIDFEIASIRTKKTNMLRTFWISFMIMCFILQLWNMDHFSFNLFSKLTCTQIAQPKLVLDL